MILFPFFNPTYFLARLVFKFIIKRFSLSTHLYTMFFSLFSLSNVLISNVGFFSTLRVINTIRNVILNFSGRVSLTRLHLIFRNLDFLKLNPFVLNNIRPIIFRYIKDCLKYPTHVNKLFVVLISSLFYSFIKHIMFYIFKIMSTILLFALGISWNDSLSNIFIFKYFSNFIIDIYEYLFSLNIPKGDIPNNVGTTVSNIPDLNNDNLNRYFPGIFGYIIVGSLGLIIGIILINHNYPDTFSNLPVVHTISESIYNSVNILEPSHS